MPTQRAKPEVVAMLQELLAGAKRGELTDLFVVYRLADGSHDHCFQSDDFADLLYQAGGEIIRARSIPHAIQEVARGRKH